MEKVFQQQREACLRLPQISYDRRMALLQIMETILLENDEAICEAVSADFGGRSFHETRILEITPSVLGLRYTRKRLKKWMRPQRRHVSPVFFGGKNRVIPQAKGVVGIVVPWNYPLFLALSPMTNAVAAGNRVMVKQAANSQNLCQLLQQKFSEKIPDTDIAFLPGADPKAFSSLPFDHLVFTGSPRTGKIVMADAARNLTPVTLELGGKSPTILGPDFHLPTAVSRIMFAKLMNAGQTCVAPDYLFVPEGSVEAFLESARKKVAEMYRELASPDYTAIIDGKAFSRLKAALADAEEKGARVHQLLPGPGADDALMKIAPAIVTHVTPEMTLMREEIFGPLLPIMSYSRPEEVIGWINRGERPLALYAFSNDREFLSTLTENTRSGGITINDCAMHVAQHDIPFGGTGNSGIGHYHGYEGFAEFSKLRPVFTQSRWPLAITPPYGRMVNRIYGLVKRLKWLS